MLTKYAIRGKTVGIRWFGTRVPHTSQEDFTSQKEGKDMNPKPGFSYVFYLYKTLSVKCSICELLVLNPDLDPLVIVFQDIDDQNFNR